MGRMIEGQWRTDEELSSAELSPKGEFIRAESKFRSAIAAGQDSPHPPEKGRYHLFLAKS